MEPKLTEELPGASYSRGIEAAIEQRSATVAVVGLGYVGLPLALAFVEAGFATLGVDIDRRKIDALRSGESYVQHLGPERVRRAIESGALEPTDDLAKLARADAVLIAVPTPLTPQREPDMSHVRSTAMALAKVLRPGQLVVLESTTYPGTCDELVRPILESSGLTCGHHFFLAYSPEREDPGNRSFDTRSIPKVVGGVDGTAARLARRLYASAVREVVPVSSARVAEATKLTENVFRAVNIALVNELKVVFERMGIDVWEVLDAAATKPFGFMRFEPGPGLGGHCIPLDPFYLAWKAREHKVTTRFIELAGEINVAMPRYVIERLQGALNERGRALRGSRVLVLGLAYKPDVDDPRESPSFELIELLLERGADVSYHDPYVPRMPAMRSWPTLPPLESMPIEDERLRQQDAVLVATHHRVVDYARVAALAPLVIDTRGVYREPLANVVKA
jgi:UDP-N-acetyl-D-glucosamine dehydrogenase